MASTDDKDNCYSRYNCFRNTNFLINFKKYKYNILTGFLIVCLVGMNIYFGVIISTNNAGAHSGNGNNEQIVGYTDNNVLSNEILNIKSNIMQLNNQINNSVHHSQFAQATHNLSSNFNLVTAEVFKHHENFQNISFIINEFEKHKNLLEFNITTIFSLFLNHSIFINEKIQNFIRLNDLYNKSFSKIHNDMITIDNKIKEQSNKLTNYRDKLNEQIKNNSYHHVNFYKNLTFQREINANQTENYYKNINRILELKTNIEEKLNVHKNKLNNQSYLIERNNQGYKIYIDSCPENLKLYTSIGSMFLCYY